MSGRRSKQARRRNLMAADPHCPQCGVELVYFIPAKGQTLPPNFATIEHVNSLNQAKPRPLGGQRTLLCLRCNEARGAAEEAALGIDELHRRATHSGKCPPVPGNGGQQRCGGGI